MIYRFMRLILFFDLPVQTQLQLSSYRKFVRDIKKEGFAMLQKSVYSKLVDTTTKANATMKKIKKYVPKEGRIDVLTITEKQFSSISILLGEAQSKILDNDERLVVL